jgi:hypothetical protein
MLVADRPQVAPQSLRLEDSGRLGQSCSWDAAPKGMLPQRQKLLRMLRSEKGAAMRRASFYHPPSGLRLRIDPENLMIGGDALILPRWTRNGTGLLHQIGRVRNRE